MRQSPNFDLRSLGRRLAIRLLSVIFILVVVSNLFPAAAATVGSFCECAAGELEPCSGMIPLCAGGVSGNGVLDRRRRNKPPATAMMATATQNFFI